MVLAFNSQYPTIQDLRRKTEKRIPRFAFEYLDGGCNEEVNLRKNTAEIRELELKPFYLRTYKGSDLKTQLLGEQYALPFGVAPIGLQGMIWPGAPEILASAAFRYNIPYILSTVSTASIETIAKITEGKAWFQLYHPKEEAIKQDIIQRAWDAGIRVLVILSDVPSFSYRPKEIKNGLAIPPRMTVNNMLQILGSPNWAIQTLRWGIPQFKTLTKYMPGKMNLRHLGLFMNATFEGRLTEDRVKKIRDQWKGKLVLKGVATEEDAAKAIEWGLDGIIVSNHGGRQLDAGQSTIKPLRSIAAKYGSSIEVMMDSGIRSGPDIARTLAAGARFTFLGRSFMYGVGALGPKGGDHTITILKKQLQQVLEQCGCERIEDLPLHLV